MQRENKKPDQLTGNWSKVPKTKCACMVEALESTRQRVETISSSKITKTTSRESITELSMSSWEEEEEEGNVFHGRSGCGRTRG